MKTFSWWTGLLLILCGPVAAESELGRPNIVLLIADDLGYGELGCQGNSQIPTPHIDSLAEGGVRFTNAYVTAPYCSASRAGLMTGRYQSRFGYEFPVVSLDIFPAAVAAAEGEVDEGLQQRLDGVDLVPFLRCPDETAMPHHDLFWRLGNRHALRYQNWKLVRPGGRGLSAESAWELYDLDQDVSESRDVDGERPAAESIRWLVALRLYGNEPAIREMIERKLGHVSS